MLFIGAAGATAATGFAGGGVMGVLLQPPRTAPREATIAQVLNVLMYGLRVSGFDGCRQDDAEQPGKPRRAMLQQHLHKCRDRQREILDSGMACGRSRALRSVVALRAVPSPHGDTARASLGPVCDSPHYSICRTTPSPA